ncbi:MAG: OmpH family outer membrane protein [Phycisphaerales bacterium]
MSTRERLFLYGLLAVLAALVVFRSPWPERVAAAEAMLDDPALGPASSLVLKGPKGDLTVRNDDGRIGWGKPPFGRVYSVGFVHITKPLRKLREQARFVEEAEALGKELSDQDAEYRKKLQEMAEKVGKLGQDSPEYQDLFQQGEKMYQEYVTWQRAAVDRKGKLDAAQLEKAYRQLIDAVEVVSEKLGVDIVYRFIATSDPFEATDLGAALNEVRFRSVLRYPQALDITPDVLKELGFGE